MKWLTCGNLLILFTILPTMHSGTARDGGAVEANGQRSRLERLHREFDFETFRELPLAAKAIDFEDIDYELLSAAVFHETNRRRARHDLPVLAFREELREAARIQARGMVRSGMVAHQHPDETLRTLRDRLKRVGLRGAFSAENVAMTFGIRYEAGRPVATRKEDGGTVFSYEHGGEPIEPHSYLSLAENLLSQWMDSPGHRENILRREPEELGTGHVHDVNKMGMDVFYSVQVFFSDQDVPPGAKVVPVPTEH